MNIKPTEQQVRKWAEGAGKYADMKRKTWEAWDLLRDQKLAELAAKWGAEQAQPNATPRKSMAYTPRQEQIIMVCDILHRISESYDHWKGWSGIQSSCEQAINLLRYDSTQAQQPTEKGTACSTSNFRKKPVVIQAKQLTEETIREVYELVHGPVTLKHRLAEDRWDDYCGIVKTDGMNIPTLEDGSDGRAKHVASIGDWIIRGIAGEFYPCKPDIFAATYEPVAQAQHTTEPELPEAAKCEGGWGELCVYYYTAAQMHDHFAAGVRSGMGQSQWQPIETAPKDGRSFDVWVKSTKNPDYGVRMTGVYYVQGVLCGSRFPNSSWCEYASHWMPLPEPPAMQGDNHE